MDEDKSITAFKSAGQTLTDERFVFIKYQHKPEADIGVGTER